MRRALGARLAVALGVGAVAFACHRASGSSAGMAARAVTDSLQGIVRVVGVDALPQVTLTFDDATPVVTLLGPPSLRKLAGLRVAVVGERAARELTVTRFAVVAANGVPATDGILAADGDRLVLTTADGVRHPLANPTPGLRAAVGHRVWISGTLSGSTVAYGVIE